MRADLLYTSRQPGDSMDLHTGPLADVFDTLDRSDAMKPEGLNWFDRLSPVQGHHPVERVELRRGRVFYVDQVGPDEREDPVVFLRPPK